MGDQKKLEIKARNVYQVSVRLVWMTSQEGDLTGRQPYWKTTSREDNFKGRRLQGNMNSQEDDLTRRRPKMKTTS